jgi:acetyltransferase-like isoleucine patch superfamily enzyme
MNIKFVYDKFRNLRSNVILNTFKCFYGNKLSVAKGVYVRKGFVIVIEGEGTVHIGRDVFFNNYCSINSLIGVDIGDNCIFGENVHIYDHNHIYKDPNTPINSQGFAKAQVHIGNNCWIGTNVTILKGVRIGEHCVIGANCVVYKNIPDNTVVKLGASSQVNEN